MEPYRARWVAVTDGNCRWKLLREASERRLEDGARPPHLWRRQLVQLLRNETILLRRVCVEGTVVARCDRTSTLWYNVSLTTSEYLTRRCNVPRNMLDDGCGKVGCPLPLKPETFNPHVFSRAISSRVLFPAIARESFFSCVRSNVLWRRISLNDSICTLREKTAQDKRRDVLGCFGFHIYLYRDYFS